MNHIIIYYNNKWLTGESTSTKHNFVHHYVALELQSSFIILVFFSNSIEYLGHSVTKSKAQVLKVTKLFVNKL